MPKNDLKKIRAKLKIPYTVNGPDWYCETIESLAVEVEELHDAALINREERR